MRTAPGKPAPRVALQDIFSAEVVQIQTCWFVAYTATTIYRIVSLDIGATTDAKRTDAIDIHPGLGT